MWWRPIAPTWLAKVERFGEPVVAGAILVLAFVTRFHAIGKESLWLDEVITFHRARGTVERVIADSEAHHHNPAYFLLVRTWSRLGDDEAMLRAPSALFGALTILAGYALGRIVGGRWLAAATALALLVSPRLLAYAQEARMYALYVLGASLAVSGLVWLLSHPRDAHHPLLALRRGEPRAGSRATLAWLLCSLGWTIALYCHATAALFVLSCSAVALLRIVWEPVQRWRFAAGWCIANLLALVAYWPWAPRLFRQVGAFHGTFWATFPTAQRATTELGMAYFYGGDAWRALPVALLALAGTVALRRKPLVLASLWLLASLGPALVLLASFWQPMFMHRQFLWATVPFGVLVGAGIVAPAAHRARAALVTAALAAGGWTLLVDYYEPRSKEPWRDVAHFVSARARQGDRIVAATHGVKLAFDYYQTRKTAPVRRFAYARLSELAPSAGTSRRLWLVTRARQKGSSATELEAKGWERVAVRNFGKGLEVTSFRPRRQRRAPARATASTGEDEDHDDFGRRRRAPDPDPNTGI